MKKKFIITIFLLFLALILGFIMYKFCFKEKEKDQNSYYDYIIEDELPQINNPIEEIKKATGATADESIYEIQTEYDGREILAIKPDIQFKTVLAGILKNGEPTEQDIEKLDLSEFHKGIWISENSRDKFLQILKKCDLENFEIDQSGYLHKNYDIQNEYSLKLEKLMNLEQLTIIDIKGICYIRDDMTGDIVEYPFKDMDLYQISENFETDGSKIIVVTTNDVKEIDIIKTICN